MPTPKKDTESVILRTAHPWEAFDPSIEGVPTITYEGTTVPQKSLQPIRKKARDCDVALIDVTPTQ